MKIKVKLNPVLDKEGRGFTDVQGKQEIRPKQYGKGQTIEVEQTNFVQAKIRTGEIIVVSTPDTSTVENKQT